MIFIFFFTSILFVNSVTSQDVNSQAFRKYPEYLLSEDMGFCTPVIRYGVQPLPPTPLPVGAPCVPYEYYGSGGNPGFNSFTDCVYACGDGPIAESLQAGK